MERYNRGAGAASAPTPPSAPANAYFTEGNPSLGVPATQPGPWWFHMITEEMRKVITDAELTPDHTDLTQLSAAIQAMITASLAPDASETVKGIIEIATAAEAQALTDDVRALTAKKLDDAFKGGNQLLAAAGYQKLPGGLILQWVKTRTSGDTISWPIAFPTVLFSACSGYAGNPASGSGVEYVQITNASLTNFSISCYGNITTDASVEDMDTFIFGIGA